jgi:hypothetical protein
VLITFLIISPFFTLSVFIRGLFIATSNPEALATKTDLILRIDNQKQETHFGSASPGTDPIKIQAGIKLQFSENQSGFQHLDHKLFNQFRIDGQCGEDSQGTLFVYIGETVEYRFQQIVPQGEPFPENHLNFARGKLKIKIAAIPGIVEKGMIAEKVTMGRVIINKLPGEVQHRNPRSSAVNYNAANFSHGLVMIC